MNTHNLLRTVALTALLLASACNPDPPAEPPAGTTPSSPGDLWAGIDPPTAEPGETFSFERNPKPLPRPQVRKQDLLGEHPPDKPTVKTAGDSPLEVLRASPTGDVAEVSAATVTFNQPMVPLGSLDALEALDPPMQIEPRPEGRFRWLGTETLGFEATGRFPYSTRYTVTVPKGTTSASGASLAEATTVSFTTPRLKVLASVPGSGAQQLKPDAVFELRFNQRIDHDAVLRHVTLTHRGQPLPLRRTEHPEGDVRRAQHPPERTLVFQATAPLPLASTFTLQVDAEAPSAEGPLLSGEAWSAQVSTYGPMTPSQLSCGWYRDETRCSYGASPMFRFSNAVKPQPLKDKITITPPLEGDWDASASSDRVVVSGEFKAGQRYTLTIAPGVADVHGQVTAQPLTGTLTFQDRPPNVTLGARHMALLEAKGPQLLPMSVVNIDEIQVRGAMFEPKDLAAVMEHTQRRYRWDWKPFQGPVATAQLDRRLKPGLERNEPGRVGAPLAELLKGKSGLVYLVARVPKLDTDYRKHHIPLVVQVTDIGLAVRYDLDHVHILANRLSTGEPAAGVKLTLVDRGGAEIASVEADAQGFARLPGRRAHPDRTGPWVLVASDGDDQAAVLLNGSGVQGYVWAYNNGALPAQEQVVTHVSTDRNIYRPGETVHYRGILRTRGSASGVTPLPQGDDQVIYSVRGNRGQPLVEDATAALSPFGTFSATLELPGDVDLGNVTLSGRVVGRGDSGFSHNIRVEEYRAPEIEVSASLSPDHLTEGQEVQATVEGRYLFGAPMRDGAVSWRLESRPTGFTPPGQSGFHFGAEGRWGRGWRGGPGGSMVQLSAGESALDDKGLLTFNHTFSFPEPEDNDAQDTDEAPPQAMELRLSATVTDRNRQQVSASATATAHPAAFYAGVKLDRTLIREGESITVSAIAASPDGERRAGEALTVTVLRREMKRSLVKGEDGSFSYAYASEEVKVGACEETSAQEPVTCQVKLEGVGYFIARVAAKDAKGRPVRSEAGFYVAGKGYVPWRQDEGFKVELIPDKESYQPGETAKLLVKSPFEKAQGLLTLERDGVVEHRVLTLEGSASSLEIPLKEAWLPAVDVALTLVRGRVEIEGVEPGQDLGRPAFAAGTARLALSTDPKRLTVAIQPDRETIAPGETLAVDLTVTDAAGAGREAEVALFVVDEAVLSLLGYATPDPLSTFHVAWGSGTVLDALHNHLIRRDASLKKATVARKSRKLKARAANLMKAAPGAPAEEPEAARDEAEEDADMEEGFADGDRFADKSRSRREGKASGGGAPIKARTNFLTTAYVNTQVVTDADGKARVEFEMPENLTTYRIMAVAVDRGDRFGAAEAPVTIRKPLLLRPALPRFASYGDRFEAGVVINNETGEPLEATVGMRATLMENLSGADRKAIVLKPGEATEVRFPVKATASGAARFQFVVRAGTYADAAEVSIPVIIPVTTEAFATYGTTEESVAQPVQVPKDAIPNWGGLEVSMSSTALTGLEDAARYLQTYRYGCLEQTSSRLIPLVTLDPVLDGFGIEGIASAAERREASAALVQRIVKMQKPNGGFGFWPGAREVSPYASVYAMWALHLAGEAGVSVPKHAMERGARYLRHGLRNDVRRWGDWYGLPTRAHAAFVLGLMKEEADAGELQTLYDQREALPLFSVFQLWGALHLAPSSDRWADARAELRRLVNNAVVEAPGTVHFSDSREEGRLGLLMHSSTRTDAIGLYTLLQVEPGSALVPKVLKGLMDARQVTGTWGNTQENAIVVAAMGDYYEAYEKTTPDFTADVWYGDGYMGEVAFKGRSTTITESLIPMAMLAEAGDRDVLLAKQGPGRLYYRLGLRYAPASLKLDARDQGYTVQRHYEAAAGEPEGSVVRTDDGWRIKAGTQVKVTLTVSARDRGYHVAVDDPLPAGLEAVNTSFKTTALSTAEQNDLGEGRERGWWWGGTFNHTEQRDERVVLFANSLPAGVYRYSYVARATTLGAFTLPPLRAEQMYAPEVFGRTATERVEVVE